MRNLVRIGSAALVIAATLVPWQALDAQEMQGNWRIFPRIGLVAWDNAAAIQDPVLSGGDCDFPSFGMECSSVWNNVQAGLAAHYGLTDAFSIGLAVDMARPISNGAYFPAASIEVAGEQSLQFINQRLTIVQYGAQVEWVPGIGGFAPFINGGIGGYTVWPEAKKADQAGVTGFESFTDLMFSIGVGLGWNFGETTGFRLEFTDLIYTGWERDNLNPVLDAFQTQLFPDAVPAPPSASSTLHNFRLSVGFTFVPAGGL